MSSLGLFIASGFIFGLGAFLLFRGSTRPSAKLQDALALLDGSPAEPIAAMGSEAQGLEAFGSWVQRRLRLPVSEKQQRLLLLQDRTIGDFFAEKLIWTTAGLFLPTLWAIFQFAIGRISSPAPAAFGVLGAIGGYFLADIRLARNAKSVHISTAESVHTFFDLVTLERLANASATQAVAAASGVSTAPLFRRITAGLERARLQQTPPWDELSRIAHDWDLPELVDFADIMRLEEQGAALAEVLQARVRELRDAHLAEKKSKAQEATEALTIWMTIPALLLGLAFIIPPLLRLGGM